MKIPLIQGDFLQSRLIIYQEITDLVIFPSFNAANFDWFKVAYILFKTIPQSLLFEMEM